MQSYDTFGSAAQQTRSNTNQLKANQANTAEPNSYNYKQSLTNTH